MKGLWQNPPKTLIVLLILSVILNSFLWYQLESSKAELDATKNQLETVGEEQTEIINWYSDLRDQINIRLGQGQNASSFITPDDPLIETKIQEIIDGPPKDTSEYWMDCFRIYCWVNSHIGYTMDTYTPVLPGATNDSLKWRPDFWRMPTETLNDGVGDCEDIAVLLASMLKNYTEGKSDIWVLGIKTSDPDPTGHVAVVLPVEGNELAILDPYGGYCTWDYQQDEFIFDNATVAINKWISYWAESMPDAEVFEVFSDQFHHYFSSTGGFINWATQRK
ncbi:MAG: transglutaminase domain-containing protein [Dehalococcoidales bacterium]|nr:MAG: transglutaminase domain-containing protein [Dehalococcoidales bacterium]